MNALLVNSGPLSVRTAFGYRRSVMLASGRYAMLDDGMGFSLVSWKPVIKQRLGLQIAATVRGGGVSWEVGRQRGVSLGLSLKAVRPVNMTPGRYRLMHMARCRGQFGQDAALASLLRFMAAFPQGLELPLQRSQLLDAGSHMTNVFVEQIVHLLAIFVRRVFEAQQHSDFVQRHVQPSAVPNERQPVNVFVGIHPVVATCPGRFGQ